MRVGRRWCQPYRAIVPSLVLALLLALAALQVHAADRRQLLFENRVHRWQVHYVHGRDFARGRHAYYTVSYRGQPLTLPRDLFGAAADIDRFFVAAGFPPEATDNDSVLLGFTPSLLLPGGSTQAGALTFVYARAVGDSVELYDQQRRWLGTIAMPAQR